MNTSGKVLAYSCQPQNSQCLLQGKDAIEFLETLIVGDVASLDDRTGTLSVFTNEKGGIIDDSVITKASCSKAMHVTLSDGKHRAALSQQDVSAQYSCTLELVHRSVNTTGAAGH